MQESADYVDMKMMQKAINRVLFRALEGKIDSKEEQWNIAVHEAGHVAIAMAVDPDSIASVSIIPQGRAKGRVRMAYDEDLTESVEEVENRIIIALGGTLAEECVLGKRYLSSGGDMDQAKMLLSMLLLGIGAYGIEFAGNSSPRGAEMSPAKQERADRIYDEKIREFYSRGRQIIEANRDFVERVAALLVERSLLSKEELLELYAEVKGKTAA